MARYRVPLQKAEAYRPVLYGALRILRDGRVRLSRRLSKVEPYPGLSYAAYRYVAVVENGKLSHGLYDSSNYTIGVFTERGAVLTFALRRSRITDATFAVIPDLDAIAHHVALAQQAGFGAWIERGLENTLRSMAHAPFGTRPRLRKTAWAHRQSAPEVT